MNSSVVEFIRREVPDWDDEVVATSRFKAFSGQRSDWEPKFLFWKDLILRVARHLGVFIIHASEVKHNWFNRGGLTPLCIEDVLERAAEVVMLLSENHWTSFCIVTMEKFHRICKGSSEASAILGYLSDCGKALYLSINKKDLIEGVKVSLVPAVVPSISSLDCDVLHLIWTTEKLQQQLDAIDQRYEMLRKSALTSLKSRDKKAAIRYARQLRLTTESREKCASLLNRVEEILSVIANAESTKKVSEAIQIGARAIKENGVSVEEVQLCLQELDESVTSQKLVEEALESTALEQTGVEDGDVEEEFKKLELELANETQQIAVPEKITVSDLTATTESLSNALLNLKLVDSAETEAENQESALPVSNNLPNLMLDAA
ncbi:PREDICTED: uncharacterized protein LOC104585580 isoform X3 [Nelumbo nucifera]|uniref:Uncharacterized protein LOC104585580 isoform X3 n=1 Tax=Nelumbo nucifera TaxID=4432 RepID=A0A1U7Z2H8_NELNU|nr:PREDICTED: uncharacterized protein LOC104585580 isoform X3 [Nelumbo nucifera]